MENVTLHGKVTGVKRFKIRVFFARQLMKISALILNCNIEFKNNERSVSYEK